MGLKSDPIGLTMENIFAYTPSGKYQTHPEGYKDISISFNFGEGIKGMTIRFEKGLIRILPYGIRLTII